MNLSVLTASAEEVYNSLRHWWSRGTLVDCAGTCDITPAGSYRQRGEETMVEFDFSLKNSLVVRMDESRASRELAKSGRCIRTERHVDDEGAVAVELHFHRKHQNWVFSTLGC